MEDAPTSRRGQTRKRRHDDSPSEGVGKTKAVKVEADPEIEAIQERMAKSSQIPPEEKGVVVDQKMVEINSDITELIEQIDEVKEEKHTVFIEKLKLYDERHTRKLKSAELTRDLQLKNVNELYDFEVQETTQVLRQETELLKHQLMNKLHDKIKKLEEIRDGVTEENRIATRKLRSKTRAHGDEPLSFALPSGSRKKPGGNYNTLSKNDLTLEENQIEEDLSAIYSEYKKTMTSYNSSNETGHSCDVRVENSILYLKDNKTLRKGSDVVVLDNLKGNEYFGDIISFASSEVHIKLKDGSKGRVYISQLRNGRCSIRANTGEAEDDESD